MSAPDDPTRPPPRRSRQLPPEEVIEIPRPARIPPPTDSGHGVPTDRSELALREAQAAREAVDNLVSQLEVVSARAAALEQALAERDETIRKLQRGSFDLGTADAELAGQLAKLGRELRIEIEEGLKRKTEATAAVTASSVVKGERRTTVARSSGLSAIIAGLVAGVLMFIQSRCAEPPAHPERAVELVHPAQPPVPGAYGSR